MLDQRITFVIPSRNNLEFLKLSYKSIKDLGGNHEVLVLDDASTDGTSEWISSLNDDKLITYRNNGPERIGIVGMFDKGIQMARTPIIMAFHADMVASPNLDKNIIKHLKPLTVVSATRVEPPLHPPGVEKITLAWGNEVDEYDYDMNVINLLQLENQNKDKTTEGIFAPWCMYREDFLSIGGHDELFAPQSKEDSDLFNRFLLNGYQLIQSWDALVYHFTSRGSRFNKHAGGSAGVNSEEWIHTTTKNGRNFIRKWGHFVKHDVYMKPLIPHKYNIQFDITNCDMKFLEMLEPWCDVINTDLPQEVIAEYIKNEQSNTKFDLSKRINVNENSDVIVQFDVKRMTNQSFQFIQNMSEIFDFNNFEIGEYEFDIFNVKVNRVKHYEDGLIKL
jgi:glycosyltransferase involved in cell wall biosynthesis